MMWTIAIIAGLTALALYGVHRFLKNYVEENERIIHALKIIKAIQDAQRERRGERNAKS